jgi:hypothetical protein
LKRSGTHFEILIIDCEITIACFSLFSKDKSHALGIDQGCSNMREQTLELLLLAIKIQYVSMVIEWQEIDQ